MPDARSSPMPTVLPGDDDLPGSGWLAIDEGFHVPGDSGGAGAELDCVGPDFPSGGEVLETASTPHYLRPPGQLLHGFGLECASSAAADRAEQILRSVDFATCLGRAVAADIAGDDTDAELLGVDHVTIDRGQRVRFTGGTSAGVRPVVLDVVVVRAGHAVGLLWFADTPGPFAADQVDHVLDRLGARGGGTPP